MTRLAIFAVVLSTICGVVFYATSTHRLCEPTPAKATQTYDPDKTSIVYVVKDVPEGKILDGSELVERAIEKSKWPPGALGTTGEAKGQIAKFGLSAGQILSVHDLELKKKVCGLARVK